MLCLICDVVGACIYDDVSYTNFCCFFFFKQKTAYEMRISDWSSDVCSSDLTPGTSSYHVRGATSMKIPLAERNRPLNATTKSTATSTARFSSMEIGRASWRERVCQYV